MTVTVSSKDAERIARSLKGLIGPKGLDRIRRKAVNEIGARIRKETRIIAPEIFGTSNAALQIKGKAAAPGSDNPAYKLWLARKIPVEKLRAKHRKISRVSGRKSLVIDTPADDPILFRSVRREGGRIVLNRAGPLPERFLAGIFLNSGEAFEDDRYPALNRLAKEAKRDLPAVVAEQINQHLARRR